VTVAGARTAGNRAAHAARALGGSRLFLRRLRLEPVPPLAMFALVGSTCFLFAALPRLANNIADRGLRYTVAEAPTEARNIRVLDADRIAARGGADPEATVADAAARSEQALPESLRKVIGASTFVVRSPRYVLQQDVPSSPPVGASTVGATAPGVFRYLTVRVQSDVRPHIRLVAGRMPGVSDERVRARVTQYVFSRAVFFGGTTVTPLSWMRTVPRLEIALSTANARQLRLGIGDRAIFTPNQSGDVAFQRVSIRDQQPLAVEVVGLFAVKDLQAPFWFGDPTLGTPHVQQSQNLDTTLIYGQALVGPDAYAAMLAATRPAPLAYEYRHLVEPGRFDAGRLGSLSAAVARLDSRYAGAGPLERRVETGLGLVLDRYRAARSQAATLLAVAAIGLLACALANIGLLGALAYDRRRTETAVSRTRGASPLHLLFAQVAEGFLVAAPAGVAGWAVAVLAIQARGSSLSAWLALALVAATIILLVATIAGLARRPLAPTGRDDVVLARSSPRRLALEGLVAVAAVLGVYLLRRRGLDSSPTGDGGFDPYLAGVPVLLGLACGIVALRLYPWPIRGAVRLVRRVRGLALHLGLSRAARQPDVSAAPLLVLVLALAITCFSWAMVSTLDAGQNRTAWRAVGADVRVDAPADGSLPARLVSRLDSIGEVARAYVLDADVGAPGQETPVVALDTDAYERVVANTPAAVRLPGELREAPIPGLVSALVSTDWPATGTFQVPLPHGKVSALTIGDRASFPGIPRETPFAVVPLAALEEAGGQPIAPNRLYLRGMSVGAVREAVRDTIPGAEISSRAAVVQDLRASPLVENVFRGFRAAIVLAALYAAVAVGLMALIAARSRSRDLALVRTMGASPRDALILAAVELTPLVAMSLLLGIGLGIAIPYLIAPSLDLAFFTGTASNSIVIPWLAPGVAAAGLVVLVLATVLVVGARTRRAGLDRVLRIGER
jgi:putative ABC transport system permease protein